MALKARWQALESYADLMIRRAMRSFRESFREDQRATVARFSLAIPCSRSTAPQFLVCPCPMSRSCSAELQARRFRFSCHIILHTW